MLHKISLYSLFLVSESLIVVVKTSALNKKHFYVKLYVFYFNLFNKKEYKTSINNLLNDHNDSSLYLQ